MSDTADTASVDQLKQERQRLHELSLQTRNWLWETDENHIFSFFSDTLQQFSGINPSDLIGTSRLDAALNSNDEAWHEHAKMLKKWLPFKDFRYQRLTRTGEQRNIVTSGWPVFDDAGAFKGFRGVAYDETEALSALRKQQAREAHFAEEINRHRADLAVVLENLRQSVMWFDKEGFIRLNNSQTATLLGFDEAVYARVVTLQDHLRLMAQRGDFGAVHVETEVARRAERLCTTVTEKTSYRIHLQSIDKFLQVDICPLADGSRILAHTDVNEEAKAENAALERQKILDELVNNIEYGTLILDADQHVEHANRMYCDLTKLSPEYLAERPHFSDVLDKMFVNKCTGFPGGDAFGWTAYRDNVLDMIAKAQIPVRESVRQDGKTLLHGCIALPQGKRLLTYLDISEQKIRQQRLEEMSRDLANANEMLEERVEERTRQLRRTQSALVEKERQALLGDLVGRLCHELRNPLNALNTSLFVVRRKVEGDRPELTSAFERSSRTIDRCKNILDDLYSYSLANEFDPQTFALQPWLQAFVNAMEVPDTVALILDAGADLPELTADKIQLGLALRKITTNAILACQENKQTSGQGTVTLTARAGAGAIMLTVCDTGTGMDEETRAKAFEPLYSTRGFGVGLGLPIAQQVVNRHNGLLSLATSPGEGTTISINLPLGTADESRAA